MVIPKLNMIYFANILNILTFCITFFLELRFFFTKLRIKISVNGKSLLLNTDWCFISVPCPLYLCVCYWLSKIMFVVSGDNQIKHYWFKHQLIAIITIFASCSVLCCNLVTSNLHNAIITLKLKFITFNVASTSS